MYLQGGYNLGRAGDWLEVKVCDNSMNPYYRNKANTSNQRQVDQIFEDLASMAIKHSKLRGEDFFW